MEVLTEFKVGSWVQVEDPTDDELDYLTEEFLFDKSILIDAIDPFEAPRVESDEHATYIFTRVPFGDNKGVSTAPFLIVLGARCVVTLSRKKQDVCDRLIAQSVLIFTTQKTKFVFQIFSEINKQYQLFLTKVNRELRNTTVNLYNIKNKDIVSYVRIERELNDVLSALVPTNAGLEKLLIGRSIKLYDEDRELIEDLSLAEEQLIEQCRSNIKMLVNIRNAYSTITMNNLNRVIELLTAITIVLTIPTMIASFYGMNVAVPGGSNPVMFYYIVGGTLLIVGVFFYIFYKKRWLD